MQAARAASHRRAAREAVGASPTWDSVLFVSSYSPLAVGGAGQFMIDLGGALRAVGVPIGICYRAEPEELRLPDRVAGASSIEVRARNVSFLGSIGVSVRAFGTLLSHRSRFRVWHLVIPLPMTAVAALLGRILGHPVVATVFAPYPKRGNLISDVGRRIAEAAVLRYAHAVVYESEATRREFGKDGFVILNGIDTSFYHADSLRRRDMRAKLGNRDDDVVCLYLGRITESKGIRDLIEAFAALPTSLAATARLLLVGPIETNPELWLSAAAALGERVHFVGAVGKDDVRDYYEAADVFVLPSYREGISSSLIEAMACSAPAVVSAVGGNPEVVVDRDCGRIVPPGDVEALTKALGELIGNREERRAMGTRARERIVELFDLGTMAKRYMEVYEHATRATERRGS